MSRKVDIIGAKIVSLSKEEVAKIEAPKLSEDVVRVIRESGSKTLQGLVGSNSNEVLRSMIQQYWRRE